MFASRSYFRIALETNSGPLSDLRYFGAPWTLTSLESTSITRLERMLPATSIARHSRVYSSITVRHFSCCPFAQASNTKSYAHRYPAPLAGNGRGRPRPRGPHPPHAGSLPSAPKIGSSSWLLASREGHFPKFPLVRKPPGRSGGAAVSVRSRAPQSGCRYPIGYRSLRNRQPLCHRPLRHTLVQNHPHRSARSSGACC